MVYIVYRLLWCTEVSYPAHVVNGWACRPVEPLVSGPQLAVDTLRQRQVVGVGEGLRRQGWEAHRVAPFVEQPPLGAVDAAGVFGEDGRKGGGDALVGGAEGRRSAPAGGGRSAGC